MARALLRQMRRGRKSWDFSPLAYEGCILWMRADMGINTGSPASGDAVTDWADQSTNSYDVTEGTASKRPAWQAGTANGHPAIRFDGSNDELRNTSAAIFTGYSATIILAFLNSDTGANACMFCVLDVSAGSTHVIIQSQAGADAEAGIKSGGANDTATKSTVVEDQWHVGSFVYDSTTLRECWLDTSQGANGTATRAMSGYDETSIGARRDSGGGDNFWEGDIAEIAVYNRVLDAQEQRAVEYGMGKRYGVQF